MTKKLLIWLGDKDSDDAFLVGEKTATLGKIALLHFPVLRGFTITTDAYREFIQHNKLDTKITHLLGSLQDSAKLKKVIVKEIDHATIPQEIAEKILKAYIHLVGQIKTPQLSISSSNSETDEKVKGEANLIITIKTMWQNQLKKSLLSPIATTITLLPKIQDKGVFHTENAMRSILPKDEKNASLLLTIEKLIKKEFYFPQSVHWVIADNALFLTEIREFTPQHEPTQQKPVSLTATKLFLDLDSSEDISNIASEYSEGVVFNSKSTDIEDIAKAFSPRIVMIALPEASSDTDRHQLQLIAQVRNTLGYKNVGIILPAIHTKKEFEEIISLCVSAGLYHSPSLTIWMKIANPAQVVMLDMYLQNGLSGVIIDSDTLYQHMQGDKIGNIHTLYKQIGEDESMLWAYKQIVHATHTYGRTVVFSGQSLASKQLMDTLIHLGVTGFCISSKDLDETRQQVAIFEKRKN